MPKENAFESPMQKIKSSVTLKIVVIGILIMILLIPSTMIQSLISERESRKTEAINEISSKWGFSQTITGPVLTVPYNSYTIKDNKRVFAGKNYAYFLPEKLNITGNVNPEIRYRGIYEAVLYNTVLDISGKFKVPDFSEWAIADDDIYWHEAFITISVTDMRGIRDNPEISWNSDTLAPEPGSKISHLIQSGISTNVPVLPANDTNVTYSFSTTLNLNGSEDLNFVPLGKKTTVSLQSKWPNPSFTGSFLPEKREITEKGFKAYWKVLDFNRGFPQKWHDSSYSLCNYLFGVNLLLPVNEYQKISRTAKYAVLFISLTFLTFFLIEILNRKKLHPIQYLLIGFALCLFYTLLLSITEHFNFNIAYLVASIGIVLMISLYTKSVLKNTKLALFIGLLVSILYSFLFVILQQQDFALLIGSTGLFAILGIVMFVTRKIDWYSIGAKREVSQQAQSTVQVN
jgi:inner membrane protein